LADNFAGWAEGLDAGARLANLEYAEPLSMTELALAHLDVVQRVWRLALNDWLNYPVALITPGDCCPPSRWRKSHADDVRLIVRRAQMSQRLAAHVGPDRDLSVIDDHSLFVTLGATSYFQWKGDAPWGLAELHTSLVIEHALVLYSRLVALEAEVSKMGLGNRRLRHQYRQAIELFSALRHGDIRAGDAREIVRTLLDDLGAPNLRSTIETALSLSSSAHATVSAEKASRRAWWLTLVGTVVAILVSVPSMQALLDALAASPAVPQWLGLISKELADLGAVGAWLAVLGVVGLLMILWAMSWALRHRPHRWAWPSRGYAWPTPLHVEVRGEDDMNVEGD
jgi:hypothetical protein